MRIAVVCTGNVARSPALARVLQEMYPHHTFSSAAVGLKATRGRKMAKPMREILTQCGWGDYAETHRSKLFMDLDEPHIAIAAAPVHMKYLAAIAPDIPHMLSDPVIFDPAFGTREGYERCWDLIQESAAQFRAVFE